jgi:hypothetical protein
MKTLVLIFLIIIVTIFGIISQNHKPKKFITYKVYYEYNINTTYWIHDNGEETHSGMYTDTIPIDTIYVKQ